MKGETICLLCRRRRIETVCGDQSCPCTGDGPKWSSLRPIVIEGLGYTVRGRAMVMERCGRLVPPEKKIWREAVPA